jgi:hypothetical protein
MKRWLNIASNTVLTLAQGANIWSDFFSDDTKTIIALCLGTAQLVIANIAHSVNPDGTKATAAYVKAKDVLQIPVAKSGNR